MKVLVCTFNGPLDTLFYYIIEMAKGASICFRDCIMREKHLFYYYAVIIQTYILFMHLFYISALLENQNKIPLECSTQFIEEFSSSASSVPSSNNTKKLFKKSQQPQVNFLIKNSESDQDCNLTCFTNPLAEDLELDLEVTGSNPAEVTAEAETVPLVVDPDLEIKVRRACERISENGKNWNEVAMM